MCRIALGIMFFVGIASAHAAKQDVPAEAELKKAEESIRGLFKAELAKKSADDQKALAEKFLQLGIETDKDPASRFVLFRLARDLAALGGDPELAAKVIEQIDREYAVDALKMNQEMLEKAAAKAAGAPLNRAIVEQALATADNAVRADHFDVALRLTAAAKLCSARVKEKALSASVDLRDREIREANREHEVIKPAAAKLKEDPKDMAASAAVGRFCCFFKGDWERGLPLLAAGNDKGLAMLAADDQKAPTEAKEQAKVGDGWWDLAEQAKGVAASMLRRRAVHWYSMALPGLEGLTLTKVKKRLEKLEPVIANPWEHIDISNAVKMPDFVRLSPGKGIATKDSFGPGMELTAVARTERSNIRIRGPRGMIVILNWEVDPREVRVQRPNGTIVGVKTEPLAVNTWHTIRWRITDKQMDLWVNGKLIFTEKSRFEFDKGPFQITHHDSTVDVKSLVVKPAK